MEKNCRFSLPLITSCRSHTEPITMAILSVSYDRKSQIRIGLVARIISVLFCSVYVRYGIFCAFLRRIWHFMRYFTSDMAFSVLFYVGYGIFCAVLRRIWHFLCCFTSDMVFSVLLYVGYGIFCAVLRRIWHFLCYFTSDVAFSMKVFPRRTIPTKFLNYSYSFIFI